MSIEKTGVYKSCAKKLLQNCAKNITTLLIYKLNKANMVDILLSGTFRKHITFYCWMNKITVSCSAYFVAIFV